MNNFLYKSIFAGCSFLTCITAMAQTEVKDEATHQQILMASECRLQWVDTPETGKVIVSGDLQTGLKIKCDHVDKNKNLYVKMNGNITKIMKKQFVFDGTILVQNDSNPDNPTVKLPECKREGAMTFAQRGKRNFWRLQAPHMQNPCNTSTDYIDIMIPKK